jgi:hypothetical protein
MSRLLQIDFCTTSLYNRLCSFYVVYKMNKVPTHFAVLSLFAIICLCPGLVDGSSMDLATEGGPGQASTNGVLDSDGKHIPQNNSQRQQSPQSSPSAVSGQINQGSAEPSTLPNGPVNKNDPVPGGNSQEPQNIHPAKDELNTAQDIEPDPSPKENSDLNAVEPAKKSSGKEDSSKKDSAKKDSDKKESKLAPSEPKPDRIVYPEHLDYLDSSMLVYYAGKSMPLSSFQVAGGNYLWVESTLGLVQYLSMTQGSGVSLMAYSSAAGQGMIYEMYPSSGSVQGVYTQNVVNLNSGYNRLQFNGGTSGRHILLFVMNNQPSNTVVIDVSSGISLGNALG